MVFVLSTEILAMLVKRSYSVTWFALMLWIILLVVACKNDTVVTTEQEQIVVRLDASPATLSPILSRTIRDTEVTEYMFVSLGDYNPRTLILEPLLIRSIPSKKKIIEGPYQGGDAYTVQILQGATWQDGSAITGRDVLFTYKIAAHPEVASPSWKALLEDIYDLEIDPQDPSRFTILTSGAYFQNLEIILSAEIYPAYLFDPSGSMDVVSLAKLKEMTAQSLEEQYPEVSQLGKDFSSAKYNREIIEGAGPYELEEWKADEYIVLKKKKNYWGERYPDVSYLQGHFERIVFQIVPDETVALTLLKNDEIDVLDLTRSPFLIFDELQRNITDDIATYSSQSTRNNMLLMNNLSPILSDVRVRRAIVMLTDVQRMIDQIEGGYGTKSNSIINPNKPSYNTRLGYENYDIVRARTILEEAGWIDSNGDGIRDKVINGVRMPLSLDLLLTGSTASNSISTILAQSAKEAGVQINPIVKRQFSEIINDHLSKNDFDLSVFVSISSSAQDDPYSLWHSESIGVQGRNYSGYSNPVADRLMERIRDMNITSDERQLAYQDLQQVMYDDYPVVFLYWPNARYAIDDDIDPVISIKRPGLFVNAFKMK